MQEEDWIGVDVWRSRPGGCPGESSGQRCGFQRPLSIETQRRNTVLKAAGRMLGPAVLLGWMRTWGGPHVFFSPSISTMGGRDVEVPALCCSNNLVEGEEGAETPRRKEKDGAEHPGSPAGP